MLERPSKAKPVLIMTLAMAAAGVFLALIHLLGQACRTDTPAYDVPHAPCQNEFAETANPNCSHLEHIGVWVMVDQRLLLVCVCERLDASSSDPKVASVSAASID